MKIRRKYNLGRIGHRYESIEIEEEGYDAEKITQRIEQAWRAYCKAIADGKVQ